MFSPEDEDYKKKINEMYAQAISDVGNEPEVEVGQEREPNFHKPVNPDSQNVIDMARAQTQDDVEDFQANRGLGDRENYNYAMENAPEFHYGGPQQYAGRDPFGNPIISGYADSSLPYQTGEVTQLPQVIGNGMMTDDDRREMEDLKRMEEQERMRKVLQGIELLKSLQGYGL